MGCVTDCNIEISQMSYTLIHEILTALNNKQIVVGIFCDLRKAFECVSHRILLSKLEQYGIVGKIKALIKSYLTVPSQTYSITSMMEGMGFSDTSEHYH